MLVRNNFNYFFMFIDELYLSNKFSTVQECNHRIIFIKKLVNKKIKLTLR